ncbi:MAG: mercury(II) reductase [Wenzhouxiangellaceae bacterium]
MADFRAPGDSNNNHYDVAVIGAGSAGFSAAITAAEQGARVVLIGHGIIGGTCVNVGCVPSKTLIRAAEALQHTRAASRFSGIRGKAMLENWAELVAQKDDLVSDLRRAKYVDLLPHYDGITYLEGQARLLPDGVDVEGIPLKADKTIVTTGARASVPAINGIESVPYLTSTTALALEMLPDSLLIIGGGVIGCELGQMFARFGVKVTICCRSRLVPDMEPEISAALKRYVENEGVQVCTGVGYRKLQRTPDGVALTCDSLNCDQHSDCDAVATERVIRAEKLLVATGRCPNTDDLGLQDLGVTLDKNGGIVVDDFLETNVPGIYAAGDVTGRDLFVYMAAYAAKLAARNATGGNRNRYDNNTMPVVIFTDPQVASVGLTEAQARKAQYDVKISLLPLDQVPRALAARDTRGLIKLIADAQTDKLIGAHLLAPEGADTIQTAVLAIKSGMTAADLGATIFPYLTTVEGLKLAAQAFGKDVELLSCCAG